MKVSFDFDDTLSLPDVQSFAKKLVDDGHEVWIVTSRYDCIDKYNSLDIMAWGIENLVKEHEDLFIVAETIGIKLEHIHFTNRDFKEGFFIENTDFLWHLDDSPHELVRINSSCVVTAIDVTKADWMERCLNLIGE